jgi:hydroxymethylpyrimidine/phosphomethylpyrimidine kinase
MAAKLQPLPVALTIAGSDSGGGAGIQADLLTFARCGVYGTTAITCLTSQNPDGVTDLHPVPGPSVAEQTRQVLRYFDVGAAKTGMLLNAAIIEAVAEVLEEQPELPVVVDPVIEALRQRILPKAALITPNLDEAGVLLGRTPGDATAMKAAARSLFEGFGVPVLLKGGHLAGDSLTDILVIGPDTLQYLHASRREGVETHGSGCTLSAAIAAHLARGAPLADAVTAGHAYLQAGLRHPLTLGKGRFINHDGEKRGGDPAGP